MKKRNKWAWLNKMSSRKPCPCCGNSALYIGPMTGLTFGVQCRDHKTRKGCGLKMERQCPDRRPRSCKTMLDVDKYTLRKAIEAWNRRARGFFWPYD